MLRSLTNVPLCNNMRCYDTCSECAFDAGWLGEDRLVLGCVLWLYVIDPHAA